MGPVRRAAPPVARDRFRGWRSAAALTVVASLVAGACGGGGPGRTDAGPLGRVRTFVRERTALLAKGDVRGYLATVGPNAMKQERAIAEGAAAIPMSYANASVVPKGPQTGTSFGNAVVEVVYRYKGLPKENVFRFALSYDLELHNGVWKVTTSLPTGDDGLPFWATGPVKVTRSAHFLALHRPGTDKVPEALAAAEQARTNLSTRLDLIKSDPVHLVLLAGTEDQYAEMKGGPASEEEVAVAAFFTGPLHTPDSRHMIVKGYMLVDDKAAAAALDDGERVPPIEVFQHELAHLALSRYDGPYTPGWVNEGAAMFLAGERRSESWKIGLGNKLFDHVSIEAVANDDALTNGVEYAYANAAVLHLIDRYGTEKFFNFYTRFLPIGVSAEFEDDPAGLLLAQNYDLTVTELDRQTRAYIAKAVAAG